MNQKTFEETFFPVGSPEFNELKLFCHMKAYKRDEITSLLCTAFNDRLDWSYVKKEYERAVNLLKKWRGLGIEYRKMKGE